MKAIYKGGFKYEDGVTQLASQKRTNISKGTTDRLIEYYPSGCRQSHWGGVLRRLSARKKLALPAALLGELNSFQEPWDTWS